MGGGYLDPEPLIRSTKTLGLLNKQLQSICAFEGLSKIGVKAELQNRIIESMPICSALSLLVLTLEFTHRSPHLSLTKILGIKHYATTNNVQGIERMKQLLANPTAVPSTGFSFAAGMASGSSSAAQSPAPGLPNSYANAPLGGGYNMGNVLSYRPFGNPSKLAPGPAILIRALTGLRNRIQVKSVL